MLQKNKSKSSSKLKYLILLPLLGVMLTYVSCSSTKGNGNTVAQGTPPPPPPPPAPSVAVTEVENTGDLPIPFAVVEQVPIYPGCENLDTNAEQKECMSKKINNYINTHYNTNLGKELGFTGVNRIYVQFKVSSSGEVTDVKSRAPHPALGEEAERVVNGLPDMEPAVHDGEEVAVLYSVPISFMISEEKTTEEEDNN